MNDKELLIATISNYGSTVSKQLFGIDLGRAGGALIKIGVDNILKKEPYKIFVDFLFDENNNLPSVDDFFEAFESVVTQKPISIMNIKFNGSDVREIKDQFIKSKNNL